MHRSRLNVIPGTSAVEVEVAGLRRPSAWLTLGLGILD